MAGTTLGTAYVQIVPSAQGISGSISNLLGGEGESAGMSLGAKIGAFAKKALIAAGIGTALVKVTKTALSEGGKLEQSYLGGLDTLYGEAANSARAYAREAAAAGISMNTYSEQAVSFGAALKNAYGGVQSDGSSQHCDPRYGRQLRKDGHRHRICTDGLSRIRKAELHHVG